MGATGGQGARRRPLGSCNSRAVVWWRSGGAAIRGSAVERIVQRRYLREWRSGVCCMSLLSIFTGVVCCLLWLLFAGCCLLPIVAAVCWLLFAVYCGCCLLAVVCWLFAVSLLAAVCVSFSDTILFCLSFYYSSCLSAGVPGLGAAELSRALASTREAGECPPVFLLISSFSEPACLLSACLLSSCLLV